MDPRLSDDEKALQQRARQAAAPLQAAAAAIDDDDTTPRELLAGLADAGLLGAHLATAYGGGGGGATEVALVCEQIGAASAGAAAVVAAHLTAASLVAATADEAEKDELLPALASGDKLAALVLDGAVSLLAEPAVAIRTGAEGLRGEAAWVAGATGADLLVVPAIDDGVIAVLTVEAGDGVELEPAARKLGLNGANIARVTMAGAGGRRLAARDGGPALAGARDLARIAHAALCVGIGAAALEAATRHARTDEALERSQSVQWMLADIATDTEAARLLTWYAASRRSAGELREAAAMARLLAAEAAVAATRRAVQVLGPAGNQRGAGVERLYRDAKAMELHHGAAEAQRVAVARALLPDLFEDAPTR